HLLERVKVRNIFIPFMSQEAKFLALTYYLANSKSFKGFRVFESLMRTERWDDLIGVFYDYLQERGQDSKLITIYDEENYGENNEYTLDKSNNFEKRSNSFDQSQMWIFKVHNYRNNGRTNLFMDAVQSNPKLSGLGLNNSNLSGFWKVVKDELKEIIKGKLIPGSPNTNSLVVYSGPQKQDKSKVIHYFGNKRDSFYRAGALYTGDYEASGADKYKKLHTNYSDIDINIGTITLPHHGSKYSYNERLCIDYDSLFVCMSEPSYRYNHPHKKVLTHLALNRKQVILLDKYSSPYHQWIKGW
ncbi:MAG: hypothetical protein ACOCQD_03510, partial [archaeon]